MRLLLDSVIVIDHFNGIGAATEFLVHHHDESAVSAITRAEVLAGFDTAEELGAAVSLLDRFATLSIDTTVADLAAALRRQHSWRLPDAFQAAIATHHALKLVTRNTKDFPPDSFDFVLAPYEV